MTEMERVWSNLKLVALRTAQRGGRIAPSLARQLVEDVCGRELTGRAPEDALVFFTNELTRMSNEAYNQLHAAHVIRGTA